MHARISSMAQCVGLFMVVTKKTFHDKVFEHISNNYSGIYSMLFGTYILITAVAILLVATTQLCDTTIVGLIVCAIAFLYNMAVHLLLCAGYHYIATYLLLLFYILLTGGLMWGGGIHMPIGTLIFGLVIVLAGLLLTAPHALFAAVVAGVMLIGIQAALAFHWVRPTALGADSNLSLGDVLACCVLFIVLALVAWSYIRKRERTLACSKQTEAILLEQKAVLKVQTKKYMTDLRQMQLEEMQHMYRFAELGLHGITLLHDLANHLTALKLEAEALQGGPHAKAMLPTQHIIKGLDDIVVSTYDRLHGGCQEREFNLITKVNKTVDFLQSKATEARIKIEWQPTDGSWGYTGDAASLKQVLAIVTSNAIDAYGAPRDPAFPPCSRRVAITLERTTTDFIIRIGDWGRGIPKQEQKYLFQPFHSSKKSGLGLGLYIAKCVMEMQFSGSLQLNPQSDHTEFVVTLPINDHR